MPASQPGFDATDAQGRQVQIKASGEGKSFAFYNGADDTAPDLLVALRLRPGAGRPVEVVYAGPYGPVHDHFKSQGRQSRRRTARRASAPPTSGGSTRR